MRASARREAVLAALRDYHAEHGWMPSIRELCQLAGISSTSVASYHLRALERQGRIVIGEGARAIRIVEDN